MSFKLEGELSVNTSGLRAGLANARTMLNATLGSSAGRAGMLKNALGSIGIPTTPGAVAMGLVQALRSAGDEAEMFLNSANKFGGSATGMQGLAHTASQAGVEWGKVEGAISKSNIQVLKAKAGNEKAQEALGVLGLTAADLSKTPYDNFLTIGKALENAGGNAAKMAAGQQLLGKSATELLPLFDEMGDATERNAANIFSSDEKMQRMADAADVFGEIWAAAQSALGVVLVLLADVLNGLLLAAKAAGTFIGALAGGASIGEAVDMVEDMVYDETIGKKNRKAKVAARKKAAAAAGTLIEVEEEGFGQGEKKDKAKAVTLNSKFAAGANAAMGMRIGRDVGAIELEAQAHAARLEQLANNQLAQQKLIAEHTANFRKS